MIKEVKGDILLSKAEAIAHGVAPFDHFDSGLALSLRQEWPAMFNDFKHYCHVHNPKSGTAWIWSGPGGTRIINLLTQEPSEGHRHQGHPGKATLSNVRHSIDALKKLMEKENLKSVAIPRLATGVGGLDWEEVKKVIYEHIGNLPGTVYVYANYSKGVFGE